MAEGACGWGPESPKVSVIIAAYCPGEAVHRVIDSLDAQTLPQRDFEVIFVDDGSPDDTFARLQGFAATRPNMRVLRIKNSGWPSRPRNTGIEHARGEYLLFMDHDDSLFPDGLRRAYEFAADNHARYPQPQGKQDERCLVGYVEPDGRQYLECIDRMGIDRMLPMVPHNCIAGS